MDLIAILLLVLFIWLTFKIVPAILGFAFSLLLVILQIIGVLLLLPVIGLFCFVVEAFLIWMFICFIKIII